MHGQVRRVFLLGEIVVRQRLNTKTLIYSLFTDKTWQADH